MNEVVKIGKLVLAGAGPGDEELITVKLQKRLAEADVIISDRLVNTEIISLYARKDVEVLFVGKQGFNEASFSQEDICLLLVKYALEGKTVLRLKGGDTAFYSNILDELVVLEENNIPFEIIPGITAASGASAYAGIPLTARGYSQGVQFLSYNPKSFYTSERWKELGRSTDTLVFYMTAKNVIGLAEMLLRYTRKPATPLAVISQASTTQQTVEITTLEKCATDFSETIFPSPSIIIIGEVVKLHERFNWFNADEKEGSVFRELVII